MRHILFKIFSLLILTIIYGLTFRTIQDGNVKIILPGSGYDNIKVNKTTRNDLIKLYGNNPRVDTNYALQICGVTGTDPMPLKRIYSIELSYDSIGVSFYFRPDKRRLFAIELQKPFKAVTDKKIILNESTFNDVEKAYGERDFLFAGTQIFKEYNGITFSTILEDTFPISKEKLISYKDKKVTQISIEMFKERH